MSPSRPEWRSIDVLALAAADQRWLERLVSRRRPLAAFREAFRPEDDDIEDDIKVVLDPTR